MLRTISFLVIVLLAAALPAASQQRPSGWIADPRSGCRAWDPIPEPDEAIQWEGPCVDGYLDGAGVLRWYSRGKLIETDEGQFRRGKVHGHAILHLQGGASFEGEFREQIPNGFGTMRTKDGQVYSGQWRNGCFNEGGRQMAYEVSPKSCGFN
jgi:hypothetical protein